MKKLFESCGSSENCENEDLKSLFENKMIKREEFKLPGEEELETLNELCKKCNHSLEIEESKCPVCGNENLQESPSVSVHEKQPQPIPLTSIESGGVTQYFY